MSLADDVFRLKRERNAVVLAHNYQVGEVQDVADYVGDSLGLSQQAAATTADVIVFCGVHFMAETAAVLSPGKKVLIPDLEAGCSLADSITADQLRAWKADHPDAAVVSYVNTTAEVKAESDYCCTSANAVAVVQSIPEDREVLFLPDMFLGNHVRKLTGRKNLSVWWGECHVHAAVRPADILRARDEHPDAEFMVHPECGCTTPAMYRREQRVSQFEGPWIVNRPRAQQIVRESQADVISGVVTEIEVVHAEGVRQPVGDSDQRRALDVISEPRAH